LLSRLIKRGKAAILDELYAVEACPLLARQTLSFEFTLTRIFMKLFWTGSSKVVIECQINFGFLSTKSQILTRTASFLQKFAASENSLCMLFANDARRQLDNIFLYNLVTIFKLHASYAVLFLLNFSTSHSCC